MTTLTAMLAETDFTILKKIALFFFLGLYLIIVLRLVMTRRGTYDEAARIPLDENGNGRSGGWMDPSENEKEDHRGNHAHG